MRVLIAFLAVVLSACGASALPTASADADASVSAGTEEDAHAQARASCEALGMRYHRASEECYGGNNSSEGTGGGSRTTPRPTPTPVERDDLELVEQGYTYFPGDTEYVQFAVVFENPNPSTWVAERTSLNITWYKSDGSVAGSTDEYLSLGLPGQRVAVAGVAFDVADPSEMEVQWRSEWTEVDFEPGSFSFEGVNTTPDDFGGVTTTGNIRSSFEEEQEFVRIVAVYKDSAGDVIGGDATYADFVPAGGTVSFEVSPLGDLPGVTATEMYATPG